MSERIIHLSFRCLEIRKCSFAHCVSVHKCNVQCTTDEDFNSQGSHFLNCKFSLWTDNKIAAVTCAICSRPRKKIKTGNGMDEIIYIQLTTIC